jgi:hypothetical protein
MSYAYFQGQEAQALEYYKKLLEIEQGAEARKELQMLVAKLQKVIDESQPPAPSKQGEIQNMSAFA